MTNWQQALANEPDFQPPEGARPVDIDKMIFRAEDRFRQHLVAALSEETWAQARRPLEAQHAANYAIILAELRLTKESI
jgi:hypothetical protein